jgi:hypothetical protein
VKNEKMDYQEPEVTTYERDELVEEAVLTILKKS